MRGECFGEDIVDIFICFFFAGRECFGEDIADIFMFFFLRRECFGEDVVIHISIGLPKRLARAVDRRSLVSVHWMDREL